MGTADIKQETVCFIEEAESEEPLVSTNEKSVFSSQSQSCLNFESFTEKTQKKNSRENVKGILTNDELEKFEEIFWRSANQTELRIDNSKIRPFLLVGETSQGLIKDWFWETNGESDGSRLACCSLKRCRD